MAPHPHTYTHTKQFVLLLHNQQGPAFQAIVAIILQLAVQSLWGRGACGILGQQRICTHLVPSQVLVSGQHPAVSYMQMAAEDTNTLAWASTILRSQGGAHAD